MHPQPPPFVPTAGQPSPTTQPPQRASSARLSHPPRAEHTDAVLSRLPGSHHGTPWQRLLRERALSGVLLADVLAHRHGEVATQIYRVHIHPQEEQLRADRAWTAAVEEQLLQVEAARDHEPGQGLGYVRPWPCLLCLRDDESLGLPAPTRALPLPRTGRTWQQLHPLPTRHGSHGFQTVAPLPRPRRHEEDA